MTREEALKRVAAKLAYNSWEHYRSIVKCPGLEENARIAADMNLEAAKVLGVGMEYMVHLGQLTQLSVGE